MRQGWDFPLCQNPAGKEYLRWYLKNYAKKLGLDERIVDWDWDKVIDCSLTYYENKRRFMEYLERLVPKEKVLEIPKKQEEVKEEEIKFYDETLTVLECILDAVIKGDVYSDCYKKAEEYNFMEAKVEEIIKEVERIRENLEREGYIKQFKEKLHRLYRDYIYPLYHFKDKKLKELEGKYEEIVKTVEEKRKKPVRKVVKEFIVPKEKWKQLRLEFPIVEGIKEEPPKLEGIEYALKIAEMLDLQVRDLENIDRFLEAVYYKLLHLKEELEHKEKRIKLLEKRLRKFMKWEKEEKIRAEEEKKKEEIPKEVKVEIPKELNRETILEFVRKYRFNYDALVQLLPKIEELEKDKTKRLELWDVLYDYYYELGRASIEKFGYNKHSDKLIEYSKVRVYER